LSFLLEGTPIEQYPEQKEEENSGRLAKKELSKP